MKNRKETIVYLSILIAGIAVVLYADSYLVRRINGISNVLLSVLTAGYVFLTYWILKSARQSIAEQTRPYVVASLPLDKYQIMLSIRNIGARPAFNVKVTFSPSLETLGGDPADWDRLLSQTFLPPGQEIRNPIVIAAETFKLEPERRIFQVNVEYSDSDQIRCPSRPYTIDLNTYVFREIAVETKMPG